MKREQLLKHWTVIEAFRNGKKVQVRCLPSADNPNPPWADTANPNFDLYLEYRIKPEKKVRWINVYESENGHGTWVSIWSSKELADQKAALSRVACIRVEYEEGEGL